MLRKKRFITTITVLLCVAAVGWAQNLEDDWREFLHYSAIGRFEIAQGYAQKIIDSEPDPLELLGLTEENPAGFELLVRLNASGQLEGVTNQILEIIERGRYARRTDSKIIVEEVKRLSSTVRGKYTAIARLKNAGEYAIPYMIDAMADESREDEFVNITSALDKIGRHSLRPLIVALQMDDLVIKAEIIKALGEIGYTQSLGDLKYIAENDPSAELRQLAVGAIAKIDQTAAQISAAELFFKLGEQYYYHAESLQPPADYDYANVWFWDKEQRRLKREEASKEYFGELMVMRACEWALRADPNIEKAIALWLTAFFSAEAKGLVQPKYFGEGHADAMTYATTSGAKYLHQALARAIRDGDAKVALDIVEALAKNAGEKSLMFRLQTTQPLVSALNFDSKSVRYSAAIAIGLAGPVESFIETPLVIQNLAEAITEPASEDWPQELADEYALRSAAAMLKLATSRNKVIDLSAATEQLGQATKDSRESIQIFAGQILAHLSSPDAQRAIAAMAMDEKNNIQIRILAFESLATSFKLNGLMLLEEQVDTIYALVGSTNGDAQLRSSAAAAFGAMDLPGRKVKDLILDQAK